MRLLYAGPYIMENNKFNYGIAPYRLIVFNGELKNFCTLQCELM